MSTDLTQTYFELFGLPSQYALDRGELDSRFRALQRSAHPDRYAHAPDHERRVSMQHATRINEAYATLKDPLSRARYLLELRGHVFDDERTTTQDPEFLMEQMELREALAEVREQADPLTALSALIARIEARVQELARELGNAVDKAKDQASAVDIVLRMKYFRRLEQEAQELEADLEDQLSGG